MKTAMIKTNLWDDDDFYELNIDTKLIYMLILTAPERGVGRVFRMPDRIIAARSGLSQKQVEVCKQQLQAVELVYFYNGWICLTQKSSFVQPVKGKLTEITLEREIAEIPEDVLSVFTDVEASVSDVSVTGETPVHDNDKDNVHDHDHVDVPHTATVVQYGKSEINEVFELWESIVGYKIDGNRQRNRYAASNLLKKYGRDDLERILRGVELASHDRYAPSIGDFIQLQEKVDALKLWGMKRQSEPPRSVTIGGAE